jgi:hypothetical protein
MRRILSRRGPLRGIHCVGVAVALAGCADPVPTELVPLAPTLLQLEANYCGREFVLDFSVRNAGDGEVNVSSVSFVADPESPDGVENFTVKANKLKVLGGESFFLRMTYKTPGGVAQRAVLRIESDAEKNPQLDVPAETDAFLPPANAPPCPTM